MEIENGPSSAASLPYARESMHIYFSLSIVPKGHRDIVATCGSLHIHGLSTRLFVRLYELACRVISPEVFLIFFFSILPEYSAGKKLGKIRSPVSQHIKYAQKRFAIYVIPEVMFEVKRENLIELGLLLT